MGKISLLWKKIIKSGVSSDNSKELNYHIRFCNLIALCLSVALIPYCFLFLYVDLDLLAYFCLVISFVFLLIIYLNHKGLKNFSRLFMTFFSHLVVAIYAIVLGREAGIYQFFLIRSLDMVIFFDRREKGKRAFSISLTILSVLIFEISAYFLKEPPIPLSQQAYSLMTPFVYFTVMILLFLFVFQYYISRSRIEMELSSVVDEKEKDLVNSEERFRLLFERSLDAIFLVDINTFQYLDANKAAEKLTGRTIEEIKTLSIRDLTPIGYQKRMDSFNKSKKAMDMGEVVYMHSDGTERIAHLSVFPLNDQIIFGLARDITDKKKQQEFLIQQEKILSAGALAAGMAHEINNPLAGILQNSNVMKRRLNLLEEVRANEKAAEKSGLNLQSLSEYLKERKIDKMINHIIDSGQRMSIIVNNMLGFVRKAGSEMSLCSLEDLFEKTLQMASSDYSIKRDYDFKDIEIRRDYEEGLPPITCERSKIQQVILNILRNGAYAMYEKGVESPRFTVSLKNWKEGPGVTLEIGNNGPGISEEGRKRIFEPFYTTKPEGEGTGLGLSLSYFIVTEEHKGQMSLLEPKEGEGVIFSINLPL